MRTPEEIAEGYREGRGDPGERYSIALEAAREAQREPRFAPEGEPDVYRDAFGSLYNPNDDWQPLWLLRITGPTGVKIFDVPRGQVRHILAYLSEQNRKED